MFDRIKAAWAAVQQIGLFQHSHLADLAAAAAALAEDIEKRLAKLEALTGAQTPASASGDKPAAFPAAAMRDTALDLSAFDAAMAPFRAKLGA